MKFLPKIFAVILLTVSLSASAQYTSNSYFMSHSSQSNMLNPAFAPEQGYLLLPVIGGTSANLGSNTLSADKLFYPNPNGSGLVSFLDIDINKSTLIDALKDKNTLMADASTTLLGVGFYSKNTFWSFGANVRTINDVIIPKGVFDLTALNQQDGIYNIDNLQVNLSAIIETYIGASFKIGDKLTLGAKIKALIGAADITANYDDLQIVINNSEWKIKANGSFDATGAGIKLKDESEGLSLENITYSPEIKSSGFGLGVDLGASYDILDELTVSFSAIDLGFMSWDAKNTLSGVSVSDYTYTGATIVDGQLESEALDIDKLLKLEETESQSRTTSLRTTLNLGAEYRFLNDKMAAGVLYSANFRYGYTKHEITAVVSGRPAYWFTANISYSAFAGQMGAAINIHPRWINIFVGADYIPFSVSTQYIPLKASNLNVYAGIGIPIGKYHSKDDK